MIKISAGIFPTGNDVRPQARVQSMLASTQNEAEEPPAPVGGFTALPAAPPLPKIEPPAPVITVAPAVPPLPLAPAAPPAAPAPPVVSAGRVPANVQPNTTENAVANESCHFI